jgi:hypothetical protein
MNVPPTDAPAYTMYQAQPNINDYNLITKYGYAFA